MSSRKYAKIRRADVLAQSGAPNIHTPIGSVCLNNNGYRLNNHEVSTIYPIMEILLVLRMLCLDA